MNNDLKQFSEERLIEIAGGGFKSTAKFDEQMALARIALAAKQAKPEYHIVRLELNDAWGSETVLNAYESQLDASKCKDDHGGVIIPCYTTPQPAHTEQDVCQWNRDEDSVYSTGCGNEWQFTEGGIEDNKIKFCPYCSGKIAAPKPESE